MAGIAALAFAYMLSQFYRSFLAVLTTALETDLAATKADLSIASGAWFFTFALMQFVVGVSLDRYGPRKTAAVILAVGGGGGAFVFALAPNPFVITIAMALMGIGCSPVLMASVFIFAREFPPARMAMLTSWMVAFGSAGNVIGASPLANAAEMFGWREVMAALGVITLVVALAIILFVRDPARHEGAGASSGFGGYLELLRIRPLWFILPLLGIGYVAPAGIRGLWAGPYLAEVYGADMLTIGRVTLFMAIAMVTGSFLYGPLDTFFRTRKWVAMAGGVLALAVIVALAIRPAPGIEWATVAFMLIGLLGGSYGLLMAHGGAFVPRHLIGRGVTLLNFFAIGVAGVMQFVIGGLFAGWVVPGEPAAAYGTLFAYYAGLLAIALVIYLFARDAKPGVPVSAPRPG